MNGVVEAASPSTRALGTDGRLGLMLTELRLPTIKRLVAPLCAQSDREGFQGLAPKARTFGRLFGDTVHQKPQ